ncbi:polyprenyl diphosphate synthase [Buchnera aphidicola]|uniref:Ditrans,polycis-undecaprenyl-diphosphate synthase ((2E,6E)-farnesyl-diphosphate specific) n=1 Tax=Buchnera aphidicola subsp. Melaphis rhois TaxID=118103 RepID=A0A4D6YAC3_BUCMH|nr:polyprenyl diphosphate synthase [Buchnera aphidicola]QCI23251.1 di-trans,poly-cis-decaprenylcistransferase [Buchnera aphidicola (Melaphis rhois)]
MLLKKLLILNQNYSKSLPKHVAIIMDGNGRWANRRGEERIFGHQAGLRTIRRVVSFSLFYKFKILTLYAFSSENWKRPLLEIMVLMELFFFSLHSEVNNLNKKNICLKVIGDTTKFSSSLRKQIKIVEKLTVNNDGLILNIAANYGGKWDIVEAIKKIVKRVKNCYLSIDNITEYTVSKNLSTKHCIPIDLVIRTGGEFRLSNFCIWQIAYSELYFTNVLWPDFNRSVFEKAIFSFINRKRRFGSID